VLAVEAVEELERAQHRFMRHILGVGAVAGEPARIIIGRVQMGHDELIEAA